MKMTAKAVGSTATGMPVVISTKSRQTLRPDADHVRAAPPICRSDSIYRGFLPTPISMAGGLPITNPCKVSTRGRLPFRRKRSAAMIPVRVAQERNTRNVAGSTKRRLCGAHWMVTPGVAIATLMLAMVPHVIWLKQVNFLPFTYAASSYSISSHTQRSLKSVEEAKRLGFIVTPLDGGPRVGAMEAGECLGGRAPHRYDTAIVPRKNGC